MTSKQIVIVGGGYGGAYLAYKLVSENLGKVLLVEPKDCLFHCIGALRTAVDRSYADKLCIPFSVSDKLSKVHVRAKAIRLDAKNKCVVLDNKQSLHYTDLVIATGTGSMFPGKLGFSDEVFSAKEILKKYDDFRKELKRARKILVVGGGAVGVEFSGEIKTDFPEKQVILINSSKALATSRGSTLFQTTLQNILEEKKVEVYLEERIVNLEKLEKNKYVSGQIAKTSKERDIECDMVVCCTGTKLNNEFFKNELAVALDGNGALCVNEFLQVKGRTDIFAIGDINNVDEEKLAKTAFQQSDALLETLKEKLTRYEPDSSLSMLVPIGRDNGVGQSNDTVLQGDTVRNYKSENLFAKRIWGNLGLVPPKSTSF